MPMSNLLEYSNNYSKISGNSYKYCRDEPVSDNTGAIVDFANNTSTASLRFKNKTTR